MGTTLEEKFSIIIQIVDTAITLVVSFFFFIMEPWKDDSRPINCKVVWNIWRANISHLTSGFLHIESKNMRRSAPIIESNLHAVRHTFIFQCSPFNRNRSSINCFESNNYSYMYTRLSNIYALSSWRLHNALSDDRDVVILAKTRIRALKQFHFLNCMY